MIDRLQLFKNVWRWKYFLILFDGKKKLALLFLSYYDISTLIIFAKRCIHWDWAFIYNKLKVKGGRFD